MGKRSALHDTFCKILGSRNAYFQPPSSVRMNYPAIVYKLEDVPTTYADDGVYLANRKYLVTLIDSDPDSKFVDKLLRLPYSQFVRSYKSDNLNHFIFNIYY